MGDRRDSNLYIKRKLAAATEFGLTARVIKLSKDISEVELLEAIDELNGDDSVDGIIVQLPLDSSKSIDSAKITDRIVHIKDVDGLTRENAGRLMHGELSDCVLPGTAYGCFILVQKATGMCWKVGIANLLL